MGVTWDGLPVAREPPFVSCIVVWRRGERTREFLVLRRRAAGGPGFEGDWAWTPPSGARQPGETPYGAAVRELREETGLSLSVEPARDAPSDDVALFVTEAGPETDIALDTEHDAFAWLPLEDAIQRCLPREVATCLVLANASLDPGT